VQQVDHRRDHELVSLALETRIAADSIHDVAIHDRLIEIADELLDLACHTEEPCRESRDLAGLRNQSRTGHRES
jgi:hypothetical protein